MKYSANMDLSFMVNNWFTPSEWQIITLSCQIAVLATLIALPFAIWQGYILARKEFWGKTILNGIVHLPLILPPVVTGYGLLILFGRNGWIGQYLYEWFGLSLAFQTSGAVIAASIMAFPLMVRAIRLSFEAYDGKLEDAAASLGASPFSVFLTISLPLALSGILTGAILGFAKAMGEFGATITFASAIPGKTETIPSAIYTLLQVPGAEQSVLKLVSVAVFVSLMALILSEWLSRRLAKTLRGADA